MEKITTIIVKDFKKTFDRNLIKIKKIPWMLASHAFVFILVFVVLGAALAGLIFYQYIFVPQKAEIQHVDAPVIFQEKIYQSVLSQWQVRSSIIENSSKEIFPSPF